MPTWPSQLTAISEHFDDSDRDHVVTPQGADDFEAAKTLHLLRSSSAIYSKLAEHQKSEDWCWRDLIDVLHAFAEIFNIEFKLEIPELALAIDRLDCKRYGQFRRGHNGLGLKGEIILNSLYLDGRRPWWKTLGTLLHEQVHAWQEVHGTPSKGNHHNAQFRGKAQEFGLVVDKRGVTSYAAHSQFKELLISLGVDTANEGEDAPSATAKGVSKLKKWSCLCTNVRVAVADFQAKCLKCGHEFKQ